MTDPVMRLITSGAIGRPCVVCHEQIGESQEIELAYVDGRVVYLHTACAAGETDR